jgi:hypothetical protein
MQGGLTVGQYRPDQVSLRQHSVERCLRAERIVLAHGRPQHGLDVADDPPTDTVLAVEHPYHAVNNGGTASGSLIVLWDCTGAGSQIWHPEANGELFNPASGRCLEDPGSGSWGTQLDIATCTGAADQQ